MQLLQSNQFQGRNFLPLFQYPAAEGVFGEQIYRAVGQAIQLVSRFRKQLEFLGINYAFLRKKLDDRTADAVVFRCNVPVDWVVQSVLVHISYGNHERC